MHQPLPLSLDTPRSEEREPVPPTADSKRRTNSENLVVSRYDWSVVASVVAAVAILTMLPCAALGVTRNVVARTEKEIQNAIRALPAEGGSVVVYAVARKPVLIRKSIVIDRDNVILRGEGGTVLRLADGAQAPVIIIGTDARVPSIAHRNIHVSDFIIDGNRANQANELNPVNDALRNNGVSLRNVTDCTVRRLTIHSCRSGGLVAELGCRRLIVSDLNCYNHAFDGLAAYQTEDSLFTHLLLHDNVESGLSFDIAFNRNVLSNAVLAGNAKNGIFMRDSRDNVFSSFQIRDNQEYGIFLAQPDADATKPALGNTFQGCVIANSGLAGIRVNDASCTGNLLTASQLVSNSGGNLSTVLPNLLIVSGVIDR